MAEANNKEKPARAVSPSVRAQIINTALGALPAGATAQEKQRVIDQIRTALQDDPDASQPELIEAAKQAVACVAEDVRRRLRREHWRTHAAELLPYGADDEDKRKARQFALELLEELPLDMSDAEVEAEIREELEPVCAEIKRDQRIEQLIAYGRGQVDTVLWNFYRDDLISREQWLDSDLQHVLEERVAEELEDGDYELDGSETEQEVKELVEEILADELDLESTEDDYKD